MFVPRKRRNPLTKLRLENLHLRVAKLPVAAIIILPGACWADCASKMTKLGASLLLCLAIGLTPEHCGKRATRAMRGDALETCHSTVLWVHRKLPQITVKPALPSNESYERKTGRKYILATVLWVPLNAVSGVGRACFRLVRVAHRASAKRIASSCDLCTSPPRPPIPLMSPPAFGVF